MLLHTSVASFGAGSGIMQEDECWPGSNDRLRLTNVRVIPHVHDWIDWSQGSVDRILLDDFTRTLFMTPLTKRDIGTVPVTIGSLNCSCPSSYKLVLVTYQ